MMRTTPPLLAATLLLACGADMPGVSAIDDPRTLCWTQLSDGAEMPPGREYFTWWIDPANVDTAFLYGGFHYEPQQYTPSRDLWRLDLSTGAWEELHHTSDGQAVAGAAVALGGAAVLHYGGVVREGGAFQVPFSLLEWSPGGSWRRVLPAGAPATGRYQPAFFYAPTLGRFVAIGGQGADGYSMSAATYDVVANSWRPLAVVGELPPPRMGFAWTFVPEQDRLIIFGGDDGSVANGCGCLNDTWALSLDVDPPQWTRVALAGASPEPRRNPLYALDGLGGRLFLFGGTPDGRAAASGLWSLDVTPGQERWSLVLPDGVGGGPAPRASGGALWDPARARILFGFGNSEAGVQTDLWALQLPAP